MDQLLLEFYSHLIENTKKTYIMKVSGQDPSSKNSLEMIQMRGNLLSEGRSSEEWAEFGEARKQGPGTPRLAECEDTDIP